MPRRSPASGSSAPAVLAVALLLTFTGFAQAQDDTALARDTYAAVQKDLAAMQRATFAARRPGLTYRGEVTAWSQGKDVRKVEVIERDDSGDVVTEYYYYRGALVFAYQAVKGFDGNRQVTRIEQRQYFRDGRMFRWLGGLDKVPVAPGTAEFTREARERIAASRLYVEGAALVRDKQTTGTIVDLQNGDVACGVTLKDTRGNEFSESADFELCFAKPSPLGKRVQLSWEIANVMAEECQGNPDCRKSERIALISAARILDVPPAASAASPCAPGEAVVFSCRTGENLAAVCASRDASRTAGTLQYRFGKPGVLPSLTVPSAPAVPARAATGENVAFAGGGGGWLRFRNAEHAYVTYAGIGKWGPNGATRDKQGVVVERGGKAVAHLRCAGAASLPGADWFQSMGIVTRGEVFEFPD